MTAIGSFRDLLATLLERWSGRPTLVAVAAMNAITGVAIAAVIVPLSYGQDAGFYRTCALSVAAGKTDCSLYPPLAALLTRPLTWVTPTAAAAIMTLIGATILLTGVTLETRGRVLVDRVLVAVAALGFAPVVYELSLGQITLLIAVAVYLVVRHPDGFRNGLPMGIVLAVAPKPMLLPLLVWMLVWRPRALVIALLSAVTLTSVGVVLYGTDQYATWVSVIMGAGRESVEGTFALSLVGNFSLWPLDPARIVVATAVGAVALWTILQDSSRGFVAALLAGLLLAPYTGLYAASILLLAVKPALAFAPRATRVLALMANLSLVFLLALAAWSVIGLAACFPVLRMRSIWVSVRANHRHG